MQKYGIWLALSAVLLGLLALGGCADRGLEVRPRGEMIIGGSVGG